MKKLVLVLLFAVAAFTVYWIFFKGESGPEGPKQQPLTVSRHSEAFNAGIDSLLQFYSTVKDALAAADSLAAKEVAASLAAYTNRLQMDELKKDTAGIFESAAMFVTDIRTNTESLTQSATLNDMRQDFKAISDNLYPLLRTVHYEGKKLFWQYCPMAFGEGRGANWISNTEAIVNPYLGKNHADCGEIQDTIKAQ
jgi:Cu(I)/Ag(I) efflux system membrane fusion protein